MLNGWEEAQECYLGQDNNLLPSKLPSRKQRMIMCELHYILSARIDQIPPSNCDPQTGSVRILCRHYWINHCLESKWAGFGTILMPLRLEMSLLGQNMLILWRTFSLPSIHFVDDANKRKMMVVEPYHLCWSNIRYKFRLLSMIS